MKSIEEKKKLIKAIIIIIFLLVVIGSFTFYARYIGTKGFKVKEYKIIEKSLPDEYHGMKIVHISDIHYKTIVDKEKLTKVVDNINLLKPDIVVLSGDLVDKETNYSENDFKDLINTLSNIKVTTFKYAIKGNHDYSIRNWDDIIEQSGFIDLNNKIDLVYINNINPILINGMSSSFKDKSEIDTKLKEFDMYMENEENVKPVYKIMLMHEPDAIDSFDYTNFDLILAGHSHNGQVRFPIIGSIYFPPGAKNYNKPYYDLDFTDLYISSGLGTSTLKIRTLNKPSFNLYRITNK